MVGLGKKKGNTCVGEGVFFGHIVVAGEKQMKVLKNGRDEDVLSFVLNMMRFKGPPAQKGEKRQKQKPEAASLSRRPAKIPPMTLWSKEPHDKVWEKKNRVENLMNLQVDGKRKVGQHCEISQIDWIGGSGCG